MWVSSNLIDNESTLRESLRLNPSLKRTTYVSLSLGAIRVRSASHPPYAQPCHAAFTDDHLSATFHSPPALLNLPERSLCITRCLRPPSRCGCVTFPPGCASNRRCSPEVHTVADRHGVHENTTSMGSVCSRLHQRTQR